ncbi:restriction endonuclease subunit S [Francisella salimarina]|uniref:Restriction endonuclease subunit S n=1 Tax=Francisella salimarina TaxID=2599927 RepID=A0AAJ4NQP4_9GAMM|nr:restriction endonuclease subunit S [Francisella salimarina]QWV00071.1 restriction endonuclease subunit S [Francisella salimarina]
MRSNYKKLGSYIQQVSIKNKELVISNLLGVSITKEFIPSIANTVGTDMSKYKIVQKGQFAYGPVTSRNGDKISVALLEDDSAIVSTSYTVFEIIDKNELLPEYLMMWFRREEFDRYARYMSHGSTREVFGWEEMCDVELPIPSIEKQREIVAEYYAITNRIKLNEQLNQKLEETAQAIYKEWFVDFEFPDENGKPYKSNGGEMVWCEELEKEIPKGWVSITLGDVLEEKGYIRGPFGSSLKKEDMVLEGTPVYEQQHAIYGHRNFRYFINREKYKNLKRFTVKSNDMIISCSGTLGRISMIQDNEPIGIINQALLILRVNESKITPIIFKYFLLSDYGQNSLVENSTGSAQVNIAKREIIQAIQLVLPPQEKLIIINEQLSTLDKNVMQTIKEIEILEKLKEVLLSKMATVEG